MLQLLGRLARRHYVANPATGSTRPDAYRSRAYLNRLPVPAAKNLPGKKLPAEHRTRRSSESGERLPARAHSTLYAPNLSPSSSSLGHVKFSKARRPQSRGTAASPLFLHSKKDAPPRLPSQKGPNASDRPRTTMLSRRAQRPVGYKKTYKAHAPERERGIENYLSELPSRFRLNPTTKLTLIDYEARGTWESLGITGPLATALEAAQIAAPNPMQIRIIGEALRERSALLCAAETGSGKTLAYLLPLISKLKQQEVRGAQIRRHRSPRSVVLVPSNELVDQVYSVAKSISHHVKLCVEKISGAQEMEKRRQSSAGMVDLVVSTPAQLLNAEQDGLVQLEGVSQLVIDEADTLLSEDFGQDIKVLLQKLQPVLETTFVCSATIPVSLTNLLHDLFPRIMLLGSPKLHTASDRVDVRFTDIDSPGNAKIKVLESMLARNYKKNTLVFCNKGETATRMHRDITENGETMDSLLSIPSLLHGQIPEKQRQAVMRRFHSGDINYLICTDLASRGLDTTNVEHVIMYDFPRNSIDFIHRIGRTGRLAGTRGLVNCLVTAKDRELAKAIKHAIRTNASLSAHPK